MITKVRNTASDSLTVRRLTLMVQAECMTRLSDLGEDNFDFYFAGLTAELVIDAGPMGGITRCSTHACALMPVHACCIV